MCVARGKQQGRRGVCVCTQTVCASLFAVCPMPFRTEACRSHLAETLHSPATTPRLYEESAFDWDAWKKWDAARAFGDGSFVFTVIQSIGGADPAWVDRQVAPFLV